MHKTKNLAGAKCNHIFFLLRAQRERCEMRRGREAKGGERVMPVSLHRWWLPLRVAFGENSLTLWTILCMFPANKSIVSSSISSECTFFQTLDDHVTHPVLFIPETHISSLQRMVGQFTFFPPQLLSQILTPASPQAWDRHAGKPVGKWAGKGRIWCQQI